MQRLITQLPEDCTGKARSPTSNILLRSVDTRNQGSRIPSVRILFFERYVRTLTYSILAYVNKNRIRSWQDEILV